MDEAFSQQLGEWTGFYALMGGAAATLLGLLFVAVSLRLDIFRRREVADVRLFAGYTLAVFLMAGAVAVLALAPHENPRRLGMMLFALGVAGLLAQVGIVRVWLRLNRHAPDRGPAPGPSRWHDLAIMGGMVAIQFGLIAAAVLVRRSHPEALGLLAIVESLLLGVGTMAAWVLLSHARPDLPGNLGND